MSKEEKKALPFTTWFGIIGTVLAAVISWERSHSILWATLHSFCAWLYVLWFAIWGRA